MSDILENEARCSRTAKRDSLLLMAELRNEAGKVIVQARVRNLSAKGMMAECALGFHAGDRIICVLRGTGSVTGHVTWVRNGRIGIAFDDLVDPQSVRRPIAIRTSVFRSHVSPVRNIRPIRHH